MRKQGSFETGSGAGVEVRLERVEPSAPEVGGGSLVFVEVSCSSPERIADIEVLLGLLPVATTAVRVGSRFQAILTLVHPAPRSPTDLIVRVILRSGEVHIVRAGGIDVMDGGPRPNAIRVPAGAAEPLIAICLATYEPPPQLFARQIASIRAQSHQRFVCIVSDDCSSPESWALIERETSDDERFVCRRTAERLGFYRNFESCLSLVPRETQFVALADQDDHWHPNKLSTLVHSIELSGAQLAFSDMRVLDGDGGLVAPTYWASTTNNFTRLDSLLLRNTVAGASSLFRRELLDDVLPFPPAVGRTYHDHWIACVALARGTLTYVDRPLYDWIQHSANTTGTFLPIPDLAGGLLQTLTRFAFAPRRRLRSAMFNARTVYMDDAVRLELFARTLQLRLRGRLGADDAQALRRAAGVRTSGKSLLWLLGRSACDLTGRSETQGTENQLLKAVLWRYAKTVDARLRRGR